MKNETLVTTNGWSKELDSQIKEINMKITLVEILQSESMSVSHNSIGLKLDQIFAGSVQIVWADGNSPVGVVKVQVSNDIVPLAPPPPIPNTPVGQAVGTNPALFVVNWSDLSGKTANISGNSGSAIITLDTIGYLWMRVVYTKTSGEGDLSAVFMGKG